MKRECPRVRPEPGGVATAQIITDAEIGARLRLLRTLRGRSQTKVADALCTSVWKIQSYEKGTQQISVNSLSDLCRLFEVPLTYFHEPGDSAPPIIDSGPAAARKNLDMAKEFLGYMRAYFDIADPEERRCFREIAETLASGVEAANALEDDATDL